MSFFFAAKDRDLRIKDSFHIVDKPFEFLRLFFLSCAGRDKFPAEIKLDLLFQIPYRHFVVARFIGVIYLHFGVGNDDKTSCVASRKSACPYEFQNFFVKRQEP